MTFAVRVNGQEVWSTDLHVDQVSLTSAKGEAGRIGIAQDMNCVDVVVAEVSAGGPIRLDHLENAQNRSFAQLREGEVAQGAQVDRYTPGEDMQGTQGDPIYTAIPGNDGAGDPSNVYTGVAVLETENAVLTDSGEPNEQLVAENDDTNPENVENSGVTQGSNDGEFDLS